LNLRVWDNPNANSSQKQTGLDGDQWVGITTGTRSTTAQTLQQTLAVTLQANTIYTLTAAFSRFEKNASTGDNYMRAQLFADFGGINESVIADTSEIGVASMTTLNTFQDFQGSGDSTGANAARVGDSLTILLSYGYSDADTKVSADNIRLDASAIPEPSTTALLGLGGLALILRRRR
jgi:hypothetical protein